MKKRSMVVLILFCIIFSSCNINLVERAETSGGFIESSHPRTETYPTKFATMSKNSDELTVQIATDIYDETESENIFEKIEKDYLCLRDATGVDSNEITIYVLEQTMAGKPQIIGQALYCSKPDVEMGAYRMYLVETCLNLNSMWRCIGLSEVLYGANDEGENIDCDKLQAHYSDENNRNSLSLFPTYFSDEFAEENEMAIAAETATALTQYILENYGIEEFVLNGDNAQYRNEWLESIGVSTENFWIDEDLRTVTNVAFSSTVECSLILTIDSWNFYMSQTDWLVTAEDAYLFVKDTMDGYQLLKEKLEQYGIAQLDMVLEAQEAEKSIHLKSTTARVSQTKGHTIYLNDPTNVWHEMVHALMPDLLKAENYWISEGVAEFLTRSIVAQSDVNGVQWQELSYEWLVETSDEKEKWSEEMQTFWSLVREGYQSEAGQPLDVNDTDSLLFYETFAKVKALNHNMESGWSMADDSLGQHAIRTEELVVEMDGNALSYIEAYLMVGHLVEKYDMESVIRFGKDSLEFEEVFGVRYEQEYETWQNELMRG